MSRRREGDVACRTHELVLNAGLGAAAAAAEDKVLVGEKGGRVNRKSRNCMLDVSCAHWRRSGGTTEKVRRSVV
jgi:hypothetical protein